SGRAGGAGAGAPHAYRIESAGEVAEGEFTTAPPPGATRPLTLAWSGDLGGAGRCRTPGAGYPIFRAMAERRPEVFLFVGDTVYAHPRCGGPGDRPGPPLPAADPPRLPRTHPPTPADPTR